jgi:arylsulfatase A-like enzyme
MRQQFIALFAVLLALVPVAQSANRFAAKGEERPNFLLLLSDDQTHRALGCLGELEVKTPNLDRLAKRGMLFTHCFNQGGWSGAVCVPSRTMLNTGRTVWNCRNGTNNAGIAQGAALWGETLGNAGYDTFMAGKWHIPDAALKRSFKTFGPLTGGFRESTTNGGEAYFRPAPGNGWTPDDPKWNGHWIQTNGQVIHTSTLIANSAVDFLRARKERTNPFFMYVTFNAPHDPRQSPKQFLELYPSKKLKLPPNFMPQHPFLIETGWKGRDEILAPYPRTPEVVRTHLQEYYAIITHMDAEIGRVLDTLDATGQRDNTIVIFTSDQGLAVGQHGLMGKQNLYDHSLRMPFIMAGPGISKGKRNEALFHMQSLFATTCDMSGVRVPETVQFPSIVPLITGEKKQLHDAIYGAFLNRQRSVRTAEWKLIRTPHANEVQFFNVKRDPWETRNLAADPKHAKTLAMMDEKLRALMREMNDPMSPEKLFSAAK